MLDAGFCEANRPLEQTIKARLRLAGCILIRSFLTWAKTAAVPTRRLMLSAFRPVLRESYILAGPEDNTIWADTGK
jgi:hypothetical protein